MVQVYAADIRKLPDPKEHPEILEKITDERRKRTLRYLQSGDRKRSLGAGLLLHRILSCHGISPAGIQTGENGKPQVAGLCFNLSHSGDWVICAVGEKPVGCDVEQVARAPGRVAKRFFHPNEAAYLEQCKEDERDAVFFRFWTMKESYIKMTGEGMSLPLDSIEFVPEPERIRVLRHGEMLPCHIREYGLSGYRVSVCAMEEQFAETMEIVELE